MNHIASQSTILGQFRRFGEVGPVYEVVAVGQSDGAGDQWLRVRLVENGEEVDYKLIDALEDPFEA